MFEKIILFTCNRTVRWVLFLAYTALLLFVLFKPSPPAQVFAHSDKYGHVISFVLFGMLGRFAIWTTRPLPFWLAFCAIAFALEYLQGVVRPLRHFSIADGVSNVVGVSLGLAIAVFFGYLLTQQKIIPPIATFTDSSKTKK